MKRFIISAVACLLVMAMAFMSAMHTSAETEKSEADASAEKAEETSTAPEIPANTPVTYGYLEAFKEQIKQEVIDQLTAEGAFDYEQTYEDIPVEEGKMIILSPDTEVIYRGGGAIAVTSSNEKGEGISDMAEGKEIFSGQSLEYGHIYYSSATNSKKVILVTGEMAYFTIRGNYEIG